MRQAASGGPDAASERVNSAASPGIHRERHPAYPDDNRSARHVHSRGNWDALAGAAGGASGDQDKHSH